MKGKNKKKEEGKEGRKETTKKGIRPNCGRKKKMVVAVGSVTPGDG